MALSDCSKCWETPCNCGIAYKDTPKEELVDRIYNMMLYRYKTDAMEVLSEVLNKIYISRTFEDHKK